MKLATYKDGSRDGQLVVVSRDLSSAHYANGIAGRLQQVLDDWNFLSPQLQDLYVTLNQGKARHAFAFDARQCMAPLPRAYQLALAPAYPSHGARLRAAGASHPPAAQGLALAQAGSDALLGPCDDAWFGSAAWDIDFEAGLAVVTGDLDMGASPEQGLDSVRLLMLANSWCLRGLQAGELAHGLGLVQARPATAFGPVAVTPDELGEAWHQGRVQAPLLVSCRGKSLGQCPAGPEMAGHFGALLAHLAKTRHLRAGTVLVAAPVSNAAHSSGFACLAEKRAHEASTQSDVRSAYLDLGERVRVELKGRDGQSVFGVIDQRVVGPGLTSSAAEEAETAACGPPPTPASAEHDPHLT